MCRQTSPWNPTFVRTIIGIIGMLAVNAGLANPGLLDVLLPKPELEVIIVTDVPADGAAAQLPTSDRPVYYLAVCAGYRDFAASIAGDKLPAQEDMIGVLSKVLAKQGFLPADQRHSPTQLIVYAWGTMYPVQITLPFGNQMMPVQLNRNQQLAFLGGAKLGLVSQHGGSLLPEIEGLSIRRPGADAIIETASDDLYVAKIAGYDYQAAMRGKAKLLWSTRISCPARRLVLRDTLPVMVIIAGPNIGRETPRPVWVRVSDRFKPEVKLGEPKLEEFLDSGDLPVVAGSRSSAKAASKATAKPAH